MRSVGVGLAFVAMAMMVSAPALAAGKKTASKKKAADPQTTSAEVAAPPAPAAAPAPEPAPAPAPATAANPAVAGPGSVTVHVDSSQPVSLERRTSGDAWEHVCNSPCDSAIPVSDEYRIVGADVNPSKGFFVDGTSGEKVTLSVSPGTPKKYTTGMVVLGAGAVVGVAGAIVILAGASNHSVPGNDGSITSNKNTNIISAGVAMILVGVGAAIVGGSMAIDNAHSSVGGAASTPAEKREEKKNLGVQVTASRSPTWHEVTGPATTTTAFVVPVLSGSF